MDQLSPTLKIKVFISSKCDKDGEEPKYNPVRTELKKLIERTNLATVYVFERENPSSISAGSHYTYALEDSDVCIFLIDNADGIPDGVKKEIDIVKKKNIMSIYYIHTEMIELLPLLSKDTATAIKVTCFIADYLEISESLLLPQATESVLLHNTFEWFKWTLQMFVGMQQGLCWH